MWKVKAELSSYTIIDANEKADLKGIAERRYECMQKPIHGLGILLHLYEFPSLAINMELLVTRDAFVPFVLEWEERVKFLQELIKYID